MAAIKKSVRALIFVVMSGIFSVYADASQTNLLYDTYPVNEGAGQPISRYYESFSGGYWDGTRVANPFSYAGGDYILTTATLSIMRSFGAIDDLAVGVYSDSAGTLGAFLFQLDNPVSITNTYADHAFTSSSPMVLSAGATYWLVVEPSLSATCHFYVSPSLNSTNTSKRSSLNYPAGLFWNDWISQNSGIAMKIYGTPPFRVEPSSGPYGGGNTVTITNDNFGTIMNVLVAGANATIVDFGTNWFAITLPAATSAGAVDIVVQTSDNGDITLPNAYTYNPAGAIFSRKSPANRLAAGGSHSLGLKSDGTLVGWGDNYFGQTTCPAGSDYVAIAAGANHSLALKSDGTLVGWGWNDDGQTTCPAGSNYVAIAGGNYHSLGLKSDGTLVGWGGNSDGQTTCPAGSNYIAIASGGGHSLGLKSDGTLVGWGGNSDGQTTCPAGSNFVAITGGDYFSLGLKSDGTLVGWGDNNNGQTTCPSGTDFVAIAAGGYHSLGLKSDGTLVGWGQNDDGQTTCPEGSDYVAIAGGTYHSLALKSDGSIVSWGSSPPNTPTEAIFAESGVSPSSGSWAGGYQVTITGTNLCNGSDVTSVTLNGIEVTSIDSQSTTQIVVTAAAGVAGTGDVVVQSTSYGTTSKTDAFEYLRTEQAALTFAPVTPQAYASTNALSVGGGSGTGAISYEVTSGPGQIVDGSNLVVTAGSGTIEIVATQAQDDVYFATSTAGTVIAVKANQTITFPAIADQVTTNTVGLAATASSGLPVSFTVSAGLATITDEMLSFTGPGSVSVSASQSGDANWNEAVNAINTFTATKASATVTLADLSKTYDGSTHTVTATTAPAGLTVDFTYNGSATAPTLAGSYAVTGTVNELMYAGSSSGTLTIDKAPPTSMTLHNLVQTYDGTPRTVTASATPAGLIVNVTYNGSATPPTDAGSYAVVATIDDMNYAGSIAETLVIEKATATMTLGDLSQTYDGMPKSATAMTEPAGLTVEFTYDGLEIAPTMAGSYVVTGTVNELNYEGSDTDTLVIGKAMATVTLGDLSQSYDGMAKSATATTEPEGLTVDFTYDGSTNSPQAAGIYAVTGTVADVNYEGSTNGIFQIYNNYTLTIQSSFGTPELAVGVHTNMEGAVLTNWVTEPAAASGTQWVCTGWVLTGHSPESGSETQMVMTVTNDAVLTWQWGINFWLEPTAGEHGSIDVGAGWQAAGTVMPLWATANAYYSFSHWSGAATGDANPFELTMDAAKAVTAYFVENLTTNHPTPEWWLAQYGITNDMETAVNEDPDGDGAPTWQEWIMDTDPTNRLSVLAFSRIEPAYGSNCWDVVRTNTEPPYLVVTDTVCAVIGHVYSWPVSTARVYDVQWTPSLDSSPWTEVDGMTNHQPQSDTMSLTNPVTGAERTGQFRLRVNMP